MRSVITALILIGVVIWGSAGYTSKLTRVSNELLELNYGVQDCLEKGNTEGAGEGIKQMVNYLDDKESVLSVMGNHEEIDKIRMNIAELKRYTAGNNITDALSKSETLEFLFNHLPANYKFELKNVM